jgi:hypothetical protein
MRWALALAVAAGCAAPQSQTGWRRDTYIAMSTVDGVVLGSIGGVVVTCAPYFMSHGCPDDLMRLGVPVGAVVGGFTSYWLTRVSEREPDRADWVVVGMLPGLAVLAGAIHVISTTAGWVSRGVRRSSPRDRAATRWTVYFATEAEARRFASTLETDCELTRGALDAAIGDTAAEAVADGATWPCDVLEHHDGRWMVGVDVIQ